MPSLAARYWGVSITPGKMRLDTNPILGDFLSGAFDESDQRGFARGIERSFGQPW